MLACSLPYEGKTPRDLFTQLLSQPPIPLNRARRGLEFGDEVEAVIAQALSREPAKRYPDTLIFAQELREALLTPPSTKGGLASKLKGMFRPKR